MGIDELLVSRRAELKTTLGETLFRVLTSADSMGRFD